MDRKAACGEASRLQSQKSGGDGAGLLAFALDAAERIP
jgi:hypothetical protein